MYGQKKKAKQGQIFQPTRSILLSLQISAIELKSRNPQKVHIWPLLNLHRYEISTLELYLENRYVRHCILFKAKKDECDFLILCRAFNFSSIGLKMIFSLIFQVILSKKTSLLQSIDQRRMRRRI